MRAYQLYSIPCSNEAKSRSYNARSPRIHLNPKPLLRLSMAPSLTLIKESQLL
ncbi:unnamed protein product [Chondrus crispus]|uniref:Uncharacterized protein n=1 Tax=Chondrus crispus TaxID=2769 RepID=S0F3P4_CHOCR|nr:unnamed protein product [Chondrus crispus]CDF77594.1 unnamed protein product [Chondrus crispus]|eukprot:XP_005718458.1 unnamed protein product [Chondrus crispus]